MHNFITNLFGAGSFIPHGHCYLWKPGLVWLHLISDSIIGLAYYSIPLTLFYFVRKRKDLPFHWIFLLFAAFIISCGTTHFAEIWTLWYPTYWLSGTIKAGTALVSMYTAFELVPLVPKALALPSPAQLEQANQALQGQIEERLRIEAQLREFQNELEARVHSRTAELLEVNEQLKQEIAERLCAEAALREQRFLLETILKYAADAIIVCDAQGKLTFANPQARQLAQQDPNSTNLDLDLFNWGTAYDADGNQITLENFAVSKALRGEVSYAIESRMVRDDGSYYDILISAAPLLNDELIVGAVASFIDISDRKRAEEALLKSEERFQLIAQATNDVMWEHNISTKKIWWSERTQIVFGYSTEELGSDSSSWVDRVHPDDLKRACTSYKNCLQSQETVWTEEYRFRRADGSWADILDRAFIIRNSVGKPVRVVGAMRDITDRKKVQQDLQQTLQTLTTLVQASPLPIVVIEPDMTVKLWNTAATQVFGWTEAEVLGQLLPVVPKEKLEECCQLREAVIKGEVFFDVETYRRKRDGSNVVLSISAAPLYDETNSVNAILLILQDITERQQAEANLRDSEERLRLALMAANQGLYDLNLQTGDAIVSPEYALMLGYEPEEFQETNANWRDRLHPDDIASTYQVYQDYVAGKCDTYRVEFRQRTKSNQWKWILSIGKIVSWDSEGKPLRMLGTHTDITDRKRAEAEREELLAREKVAREQAESANRIKDEFLAVLSHELRSPLNPILGWAKLLQTRSFNEQKTKEALATIERNARLQTQLIDDLLDVSRILQGKLVLHPNPVKLVNTIEAGIETVRLAAEAKGIQIKTFFDPNVGQVMGDSARLQQVVWNLLSNAVKFTPSGGKVEIGLEKIDNYAQIQVSDTGKGIEPNFLPYVFEYFRQEDGTTTRRFGGLGLGLAIVRHLVELHGGTVEAQSQGQGQGATFTVKLPLMPFSTTTPQDNPQNVQIACLSKLQILVVDDEPDIQDIVSFILEQAGASVRTAVSAAQALQQIEQSLPDVLVCDIGMPEMDGYMLMRQIRELPPERGGRISAIALTAYAREADQNQALIAGFQQHISKPVEPEVLVSAIASLIAGVPGGQGDKETRRQGALGAEEKIND